MWPAKLAAFKLNSCPPSALFMGFSLAILIVFMAVVMLPRSFLCRSFKWWQNGLARALQFWAVLQVLPEAHQASALLVVNTDVTAEKAWQKLLEMSVDVCVYLHALPTGKLTHDNVKVTVFRQNRWGYAGQEDQEGGLEIEERFFGHITEKGVHLRHAS
jgi:hypothetical protein